ncbi:MFS transporter, DHA1 family, multidrug resistance protein, partial [Lecanoromycetidae sp. Uapishka_2]
MSELIRDTVFGHFVRLVSQGKLLQYAEEKDPKLWKQYLNHEQTENMALFGNTDGPAPNEKGKEDTEKSSEASSRTRAEDREQVNTEHPMSQTRTIEEEREHQMSSTITGQRIDTEKGRDITMVSWFGDNDPENPMNWSSLKKVFVTFEICLLTFSVYIGSAIYSAGTESIVKDFGVSQVKATLGLTLFVAGYGLGPMIWAPMSEIPQIGRNPVYIGTLIVFVIFQVPTALAVNFAMLLCFRFLTGFIGSPVLATGGASIGDMFSPKKRAYGIGIWGIAAPEIMAEHMTGKDIVLIALVRPITLNFREPMVFLLNLYIALVYGLLYIWFESFPIVFEGIYQFNLGQEGLAFVGILVGAIIVIPPFFWYLYKVVEPQFNENGELQPEKRLPPAFVGAFAIPVCLFWFGWSSRPSVHWIVPIIGSGWFSVGTFLLFNSVLNYLPDAYPEYAASVLAGNDFMRSSFGAGFPLFATAMYKNLGVAWASSLLGFLSIVFIPIPFVLYRYGARIRQRSKIARKDF